MKTLPVVCLLFLISTALHANDHPRNFDGEISDSQCGFNVHSMNRSHDEMIKTGTMGRNAQECAINCVRGRGGQFVFVTLDKKNAYKLEPQDAVKAFAGQQVRIHGILANGTIQVTSIKPF